MKVTIVDIVVTVAGWGLLIWRLWYGEEIGEDRLDRPRSKTISRT